MRDPAIIRSLVTEAEDFLGRHPCERLPAQRRDVPRVDNLYSGSQRHPLRRVKVRPRLDEVFRFAIEYFNKPPCSVGA